MDTELINAQLLAYMDHLDTHPQLLSCLAYTEMVHDLNNSHKLGVLVFDHTTGHMHALASWARTLSSTSGVEMRTTDGHVTLRGRLSDGTEIGVRTIFDRSEIDLLRANNAFEVGGTFPVELLQRLTSTPDREDTRTCWAPGDQEHDHAMCEDAVADAEAAAVTDQQIDATPLASSPDGVHVSAVQGDEGVPVLGALLRDSGPCQDEPLNPAHTAELEQAIGRPLGKPGPIGGAA